MLQGFRYQRRGVDPAGNVANFVETEQIIMYQEADEVAHLLSFVQTRGSSKFFVDHKDILRCPPLPFSFPITPPSPTLPHIVPLYWSQSPQQRKPVPVLERSKEENVSSSTNRDSITPSPP